MMKMLPMCFSRMSCRIKQGDVITEKHVCVMFYQQNKTLLLRHYVDLCRPVNEMLTNSPFDVNYKFGKAKRTLVHSAAK